MIELRLRLLAVLLAASAAIAVHAAVFNVLGSNDNTLPTGKVLGKVKRVAISIGLKTVSITSPELAPTEIEPTTAVVNRELSKKKQPEPIKKIVKKTSQKKPVAKITKQRQPTPNQPQKNTKAVPLPPTEKPKELTTAKNQPQASSESPSRTEGLTQQPEQVSDAFKLALVKRLATNKHYPIKARLAKIEGTAQTRFSVTASGQLVNFELISSAGSAYLDRAVEKTFAKTFPLPNFIIKLGTGNIQTFTLPIHFNIK